MFGYRAAAEGFIFRVTLHQTTRNETKTKQSDDRTVWGNGKWGGNMS